MVVWADSWGTAGGMGSAVVALGLVVMVVARVVLLEGLTSPCRRVCTAYHAAATPTICMTALSSSIRHQRRLEEWVLACGLAVAGSLCMVDVF